MKRLVTLVAFLGVMTVHTSAGAVSLSQPAPKVCRTAVATCALSKEKMSLADGAPCQCGSAHGVVSSSAPCFSCEKPTPGANSECTSNSSTGVKTCRPKYVR